MSLAPQRGGLQPGEVSRRVTPAQVPAPPPLPCGHRAERRNVGDTLSGSARAGFHFGLAACPRVACAGDTYSSRSGVSTLPPFGTHGGEWTARVPIYLGRRAPLFPAIAAAAGGPVPDPPHHPMRI